MRVRQPYKPKPNNYTESGEKNMTGRWMERSVWCPGSSAWYALEGVTTVQKRGNAEYTEVSRPNN